MAKETILSIYLNNLRIKYLKMYLKNQIKILKNIKKNYLQIGGNPEKISNSDLDDQPNQKTPFRLPGIDVLRKDIPNMILNYIELYERVENILKILICISKKYDTTGKSEKTLLYVNNLLGFIRVYIALQRSVINISKGLWNEQLVAKINKFDAKMRGPLDDEADEEYDKFKSYLDRYNSEKQGQNYVGGNPNLEPQQLEESTSNIPENVDLTAAAEEAAAIAKVTEQLLEQVTSDIANITSEVLPKVWEKKGNPIEKVNKTITDVNNAALDVAGTVPIFAPVVGPIKLADKIGRISSRTLNTIESLTSAAEEILKEQVIVDEDGTCRVPLLDLLIQLKNLAGRSPNVAELIGAAAVDIGDKVIDDQLPDSESKLYESSEPNARIAAQIALNSAENQLTKERFAEMEKRKQKGLEDYRAIHGQSQQGGKRKTLKRKKRKRKKRTKKRTPKK